MKIFAIDTSTPRIVACYVDDERKILVELETKAKHGTQVSQVIEMMKDVDFSSLDVIGIGIGPGSLTGLRVGIAFATGLGVGKSFVQINSLKLIASNLEFYNGYIVVVRKAREGYVYCAVYKGLDRVNDKVNDNDDMIEEVEAPFIDSIERIRNKIEMYNPRICIGDGAEFFDCMLDSVEYNYPSAKKLLQLVLKKIERNNFVDSVEPLYLQKSIAELNFEKRQNKK
ncbi:MAG: tRNA (adenosine(37)-N6)-threonylcarbamoyltransferase complex dimerization subunit type 1 TsaB [Fervidobacterium sp.]